MDKKPRKPGSGRKPLKDRGALKQPVYVYLETKVVERLGGRDKVSAALFDFAMTVYTQMKPHDQTASINHHASLHSLDA